MEIISSIDEMRNVRSAWQTSRDVVALVPTMGNLHQGHLSLIKAAREKASRVVVSIFVNPLQFGEGEDYENYPRTFTEDMDKLSTMDVDAVFTPKGSDLYLDGFKTIVQVKGLSEILCGEYRPGHFVGVATVVNKLLNVVQPEVAVFGKKDYQQWVILKQMARDLNIPVEILGVDTLREEDGLAMSSRNIYLSEQERRLAPALHAILLNLRDQVGRGEREWRDMEQAAIMVLDETGFRTQFVSIRGANDLSPPDSDMAGAELVILAAVFLGNTRLIDNVTITAPA